MHMTDNNATVAVAPRGSVLNLTANSGLVLNNPQGGQIWKSEITFGTVANGVMNGHRKLCPSRRKFGELVGHLQQSYRHRFAWTDN